MVGFTNSGISKIEGFDYNTILRSLYLHENLIKKIENLEKLENLVSLNLSDNCIEKIEGLDENKKLETLLLKRNRIGTNGVSDYEYLTTLKGVTVLDVSNNKIDHEDPEAFIGILEQMEKLGVLYLTGNPIVKKIPNYRKTLVARLKNLKFLDDRPVFSEDRRFAEAFYKGGVEAEREERRKHKEEEEKERADNHRMFMEMVDRARREKQERERAERGETENSSSDIDPNQLNTYYSTSKEGEVSQDHSSSFNKSSSDMGKNSRQNSVSADISNSDAGSVQNESEKEDKDSTNNQTENKVEIKFDNYMTELD